MFLPPDENQGNKDQVTLTCLIQNFCPKDISVQWLQNNVLIQPNNYTTTPPLETNSSNTFFVFSRLEVSRADWDKRNKFTCKVIHEALPNSRILERSTGKEPGN